MKYAIGLDLGTTTFKASLVSETGEMVASASVEGMLMYQNGGIVEQDAEEWLRMSTVVIKEAVSTAGVSSADIVGISMSSQGISFVPVSEDLVPLSNAISWLDTRSSEEVSLLLENIPAQRIYRITGKFPTSIYSLPKLMWFKRNHPDLYRKTYKFLFPMDYVTARLTGEVATAHTIASGTMLYDNEAGLWSAELAAISGISLTKLPRLIYAGEVVGHLHKEGALALGLSENTTIVCGGHDQRICAFAAGLRENVSTLSLGTAGAIVCMMDGPKYHNAMRIPIFPHLSAGSFVSEACINTAGGAIKWARDVLAPSSSYSELDRMAASSVPGANGVMFFPYLSGAGTPHAADLAEAGFDGLRIGSSRNDMIRAVFEGIAFECRFCIDEMRKLGAEISAIRVFGGGSRSSVLCQLIAEATGVPLYAIDYPDIGNIGCAQLVFDALGYDMPIFSHGSNIGSKVWIPQQPKLYDALFNRYATHASRQLALQL